MPHIDAAGFSTFVQIQTGRKVWWVGTEPGYIVEDDPHFSLPVKDADKVDAPFLELAPLGFTSSGDIDVSKYKWTCHVLNPGDCL